MNLKDVRSILGCEIITGEDNLDREIYTAFSSDLMSDVLAYANKRTLLLTGLTNPHVIRTAEMVDISAIVFVRNKKPDSETIRLANENGIVIMCTKHTLYTASGKLYTAGLQGLDIKND